MEQGFGLLPTPSDRRDFSSKKVFGSFPVNLLPEEYFVKPLFGIKNQEMTDMCAAYASTSVSEDQELCPLSEDWQFAQARRITGYTGWGIDLRSMAKSYIRYGSVEKRDAPFSWKTKGRDFVSDWKNWPKYLEVLALLHMKSSFAKVTGWNDTFDNFRVTLFLNKDKNKTIFTGCRWSHNWTFATGGIITEGYTPGGDNSGHAVKYCGWKKINNKPHAIIQNSWGDKLAYYYFPREIFNREFTPYGGFLFTDLTPLEMRRLSWGIIENLVDILQKAVGYIGRFIGL